MNEIAVPEDEVTQDVDAVLDPVGIGDLRAANWFEPFLNVHDHRPERSDDNGR